MSEKISLEERVARARAAQKQFEFATQEQADAACRAVLKVVFDNAEKFGPMAAEESRMGSREDKIAKCRNKSALIWNDLKDKKSCGIIRRIPEKKMLEIAKPMGVVASIIPSTNPVVTPMSNGAYALKTRNAIIFSPHPRAVECTNLLVGLFRDELKKLGLPEDLIQVVDEVSIEASAELMAACDLVVATGGNDMVKSAYSSGKPAIGVGQGNVQTIIDENADIAKAVGDIIIGRSFDNSLICLGEQCVHVPESKLNEIVTEFKKQGAYIVEDAEEKDKLREVCFPGGGAFSRFCVGNTAPEVAEQAGIADVPAGTRVLAAVVDGVGAADVLCREKLCPVMGILPYKTFEEGVANMVANLEYEGKGHSIGIHSADDAHIEYAAIQCSVSRVVVNQPSGTTGGGSPTNGFTPTTTLGCGSWGNNSFAGNLSYEQFMNITRVGYPYEESYLPDPNKAWL